MTAATVEESMRRLRSWLDDVQLSNRLGTPHYENPGELKADLRVLLEASETVRGDVYLWRLGEIDTRSAMEGVRNALGC